VNNTIEGDL